MITKISIQQVAIYGENPAVLETNKKINIIYGLNGTGKTTISKFLRNNNDPDFSKCSIEGLNNEKLLVYNQGFIDENFYQDTQKGIFSLKSENKKAKVQIENANKEIKKINDQIKNDEVATGFQFDLDKNKESIADLQKTTETETWKIKTEYSGGDRILQFCLEGKMGSKNSLFEHISKLPKLENKPQKTTEDLKKEAEATQGENAKPYNESLIKKVDFDFEKIEKREIFKEVIIGNENSQVAELIAKLNNSD